MKTKYTTWWAVFCLSAQILLSDACKKQDDFLAQKPNAALSVPTSLSDLQLLLQNEAEFNVNEPALGEMSADDFLLLSTTWTGLSAIERNSYIWASQVYDPGVNVQDWSIPYHKIYVANVALDALPGISFGASQQALFDQVKGAALFYRSNAFYTLIQIFAKPYDPATSAADPGIPLRLNSDLNAPSTRASVLQCYEQILADLKQAATLLPVQFSSPTQPSQVSANALLARIYLALSDYPNALKYAGASLALNNNLTDYNTLTTPTTLAVNTSFIKEDIYHTAFNGYLEISGRNNAYIDPLLYGSYDNNDLRKTKLLGIVNNLPEYPRFIGSYDYNSYKYNGLANDEIYLIRAECNARAGNTAAAMSDLNTLLITRWKAGTFVPYKAANADDALNQVLSERRKELIFRGTRWTDLRRLNKESRFATTLTHVINGITYLLPPNDPRYVLPIPDNEIALSGIAQNPR